MELLLIDKLAKDLDPAIKVSLYLNKAEELFKEALDYLNRGDLIQASEKAWGACASVVKAYAEGRGMEHYRHRQLEEAMSRLISERGGDKELISGWGTCLRLHSNFYEGFMTRQDLEAWPPPRPEGWGFTLGVSGVTPSLGVTENPSRAGIHKPIPRSEATPP